MSQFIKKMNLLALKPTKINKDCQRNTELCLFIEIDDDAV